MKGLLYKNAKGHMASSLFGPIIVNPKTDTTESRKQYAEAKKRWENILKYTNGGKNQFYVTDEWFLTCVEIQDVYGNLPAFESGLVVKDDDAGARQIFFSNSTSADCAKFHIPLILTRLDFARNVDHSNQTATVFLYSLEMHNMFSLDLLDNENLCRHLDSISSQSRMPSYSTLFSSNIKQLRQNIKDKSLHYDESFKIEESVPMRMEFLCLFDAIDDTAHCDFSGALKYDDVCESVFDSDDGCFGLVNTARDSPSEWEVFALSGSFKSTTLAELEKHLLFKKIVYDNVVITPVALLSCDSALHKK